MSYELFTGPSTIDEVKKYIRVYDAIYIGPADHGHQDIAEHFNIEAKIHATKKNSRKDVDGGFMEVNAAEFWVEFDNASGTYGLEFHEEAREGTVFVARPVCEGYEVRYKKIDDEELSETKTTSSQPFRDDYERDGEDSFFSVK